MSDQQLIEGEFSGPAWEAFVKRQWQAYLERQRSVDVGLYEQQALRKSLESELRALRKSLESEFCTVAVEKEYSSERHGRKGRAMIVSGEAAPQFNAVRLDNFENANKGPLVSADSETGEVVYLDVTGEQKTLKLGDHAIRILKK